MGRTTLCFDLAAPLLWNFGGRAVSSPARSQSPMQAAARYVALANEHDLAGLVAMLARPCDMFGEQVTCDDCHGYVRKWLERWPGMHIEITRDLREALGDPHTIEFECVVTWWEGDRRMQIELGEFLTFTAAAVEGLPRIVRMGYTRPPSEPVLLLLDEGSA